MIGYHEHHFCLFCAHFARDGKNSHGHCLHPRVKGENRCAFASCLLFELDLFRSL